MVNRLKNVGLILTLLTSVSVFGQAASDVSGTSTNVGSFQFAPNYNIASNSFTMPNYRSGSSSFHGHGSMALVENFMGQLNLRMPPTNYRFVSAGGVNFQAGLLMNSRQPKLGASFSMPRGFNFSAGYGLNGTNLMKPGMAMGRNPGIQFSASYRLFKRGK